MKMVKGKFPKYLLILALTGVTIIIFIENFIFSSDFTLLSLRSVDDGAFQDSLHKYHSWAGIELLSMNDYGYGWIWWFPLYLITYPAYLLFEATGVSWLLIILPRMCSLCFGVMCSVLCYKLISIYTKNEWIKMAIVFMMPLFPVGATYVGRFSTVSQVAFFSILSIYLVAKNETMDRKRLRYSLLAFAIAMATKVSAIVAAPLLVLLVLARYKWEFSRENFKVWISEALLAIFVMIVLMCPIILLAPVYPQEAKNSFEILLTYWIKNQGIADIVSNFKFCCTLLNFKWVAALLNLGLLGMAILGILKLRKDKDKIINWDYVLFPVGYYIGIFYLSATVSSQTGFIFMYATAVSFVAPFGILLFDNLNSDRWRGGGYCIKVVTALCCLCQILTIKSYGNIFSHYQVGMESKEKVESLMNMEKAVEELHMDEINYYVDWGWMSNFYSYMEHEEDIGHCQAIWDNFGELTDETINLVALSKHSTGFQDDNQFEESIKNMELQQQEQRKEDRRARLELVQNGRYLNRDWMLIYEDDNAYIFKKDVDAQMD